MLTSVLKTTALLIGLSTAADAQDWTLDSDSSALSFGSIKKDTVGETHRFQRLSGQVAADGAATIEIDLTSVETYIDIRNERMIEHVFGEATTATLSARIDMAQLTSLPVGGSTTTTLDGSLAFLGSNIETSLDVFVLRTAEDRVLVTSDGMHFISTEEAGLDAGVDTLMQLAELSGITRTVPVTFRLMFNAGDGASAAPSDAPAGTQAVAGDATAGEREFRQCRTCHDVREGRNKVGPSLYGLFGATSGQVEGFRYSNAMKEANIVWSGETLAAFLMNPKDVVPGNRMSFRGQDDPEKLSNLIAYLNEATAAQ